MSELIKLVNTIEFTDEMKQLQKDYEKLVQLSELLDKANEILNDLFDTKPECMNAEIKGIFAKRKRLDSTKAIKDLETLQSTVDNESWYLSLKVCELYNFQRLGNAIGLQKELNNSSSTHQM